MFVEEKMTTNFIENGILRPKNSKNEKLWNQNNISLKINF